MDHLLHFLKLMLNPQELIGFQWVLPFSEVDLKLGELNGIVSCQVLIEQSRGLELISKLHNELVEKRVRSAFIILIVSDCRGCDAIERHPAVTLSNVVFE